MSETGREGGRQQPLIAEKAENLLELMRDANSQFKTHSTIPLGKPHIDTHGIEGHDR